ncbi:type II toxin-antitoxin system VapC family toxin [Spirobacillus cienkowskii]|jgi:PIN domain nuclease of toxin-antitoxin system|uniref:Type II toxin-antitoxin system VapC family toxin n=1 Tax=Spirobacillus cienkowskii TaxID=495820 RepID=A0A369KY83_9BACT|nr:MAG: type II toxin-antitoxin system VapC family toxin [Spirobacillus cienkowskii]
MKILLDTHIIIWIMQDSKKLTKKARKVIDEATEIYYSPISIWEIIIKKNLGKLDLNLSELKECLDRNCFRELPLTSEHVITLNELPNIHKDPFDRIIISQALCEPLKLITADVTVKQYSEFIILI